MLVEIVYFVSGLNNLFRTDNKTEIH